MSYAYSAIPLFCILVTPLKGAGSIFQIRQLFFFRLFLFFILTF